MRVLELYSGIGGMHYALEESGVEYKVVASVDINTAANEVYRHNFPNVTNLSRNIQSFTLEQIEKMSIDTIVMSPPCQPFTRVGLKKDVLDERTCSLLHILELIPGMDSLEHILVENVKGFETSQARDKLVECISRSNFNYKECILSPCQFGIPNTRHRYYLIAKKKHLPFLFTDPSLVKILPREVLDALPTTKHQFADYAAADYATVSNKDATRCYGIKYILEENINEEEYLLPEKILQKYACIVDIQTPASFRSCCFTKAYSHYIEGTGSVFCPFSEDTIARIYSEIKIHPDNIGKQLELLRNLRLRYFTPREVSRLMCFPEHFHFPESTTKKQKYRLLGNSINVHVVSKLIQVLNHGNVAA